MPSIEGALYLTPHYKRKAEAYRAEFGAYPDWYAAFNPSAVPSGPRTRAARIASGETLSGDDPEPAVTDAARLVQKATKKAEAEKYEIALYQAIERAGLPLPVRQFHYLPGRRVAADLAYPARKIILEVQGGVFQKGGGRHNRGAGYEADRAKYAEAILLGWRVFEFGPTAITSGAALETVTRILATFPELPEGENQL